MTSKKAINGPSQRMTRGKEKNDFRCCRAELLLNSRLRGNLNGEERLAWFSTFTTVKKKLGNSVLMCVRREVRLARGRVTDTARKFTVYMTPGMKPTYFIVQTV